MTEHVHAVIDGVIQHTSVSQIQRYSNCARAWWFNKVAHLPDKPPSKGQQTGTEGHARLEVYYTQGLDVLSPLEKLGMARGHVPPADRHLYSEVSISGGLDAAGVPLEGYIDLLDLRALDTLGEVGVKDWKFKSSIESYGIKKEDIFNPDTEAGIQLIGYAEYARRRFANAKTVSAGHVTFQTKGARDVSAVFDTISVDRIPALWERVSRHVHGMLQVARENDWHKVPGTYTSCKKYGGCAYLEKCFDPLARLTAAISGVSLKLEGRSMGLLSTVQETPPPLAVQEDAGVVRQEAVALNAQALSGFFGQVGVTMPLVLPPDAPEPTPVTPYSPSAVPAPQEQPVAEAASPTAETPTLKRGRPRKNSPTAQHTATTPAAAATVPEAPVGEPKGPIRPASSTPSGVRPAKAEPEGKLILYFNAFRMGVEMRSLAAFTRMVELDFLKQSQSNLIDLRAATDSALGFSKWKSYLGAAAVGRIQELPPGHYAVTETDERIQCVAEALAAALPSDATIRGIR